LKEVSCDLRSIPAIQGAIRQRAAQTPPGQWVVGFMYDDTKTAEGRALTIADLHAAAPNHPVIVTHRGGHTSWVELAGSGDRGRQPKNARPARRQIRARS